MNPKKKRILSLLLVLFLILAIVAASDYVQAEEWEQQNKKSIARQMHLSDTPQKAEPQAYAWQQIEKDHVQNMPSAPVSSQIAENPQMEKTPGETANTDSGIQTQRNSDLSAQEGKMTSAAGEALPRYYDVPLSHEQQDYVFGLCEQYQVPFDLVLAVMQCESGFNAQALSAGGDYGIMQLNQIGHAHLTETLGVTDFLNFEENTLAGIYVLSDLLVKYKEPGAALMAYNCGEGGAAQLWEQGIYATVYSETVLAAREQLAYQ